MACYCSIVNYRKIFLNGMLTGILRWPRGLKNDAQNTPHRKRRGIRRPVLKSISSKIEKLNYNEFDESKREWNEYMERFR